jgi:AraC-like DNA-binding protein
VPATLHSTLRDSKRIAERCFLQAHKLRHMDEKSVEPLIAAAHALELCARRALGDYAQNWIVAADSLAAMRARKMPTATRVSSRPLRGPRVDLSPARQGGLASVTVWPQDHVEATRFPILCGVLEGEAALPMTNYCLHIPAGNLVFIPAGVAHPDGSQPHLSRHNETDFCDLFWLYRWEGGLTCHLCHSRGHLHENFCAEENCFIIGEDAIAFFDLLANAMNVPGEAVTTRYLLPALLAVVGADLHAGRFVQPGVLPAGAPPAALPETAHSEKRQSARWKENYGAVLQAQNYISFHIDQPLLIDHMAQMACMSRSQFTQLFRRATGNSMGQYLASVRLERAKLYLRETDWNVDTVARAVGWRGAHLWKMFARELGTTPGEFRRTGKVKSGRKRKPKQNQNRPRENKSNRR